MALLSAGILTGCQARSPAPPPAGDPPPGQVLQNFEMQDIQDGMKSMTLKATEGRMYDEKHQAELEMPKMSFYKKGLVTSTLRAPKGKIDTLNHDVLAWGGVSVTSADSATLTTEHLHYSAKNRTIHTDDAVHFEKPDSVTDGTGLDADPEMNRVRIGHQTVRFRRAVSGS